MLYVHKVVEFSKAMFTILPNYLPLLQPIADLLKKIGLVGTLVQPKNFQNINISIGLKKSYWLSSNRLICLGLLM